MLFNNRSSNKVLHSKIIYELLFLTNILFALKASWKDVSMLIIYCIYYLPGNSFCFFPIFIRLYWNRNPFELYQQFIFVIEQKFYRQFYYLFVLKVLLWLIFEKNISSINGKLLLCGNNYSTIIFKSYLFFVILGNYFGIYIISKDHFKT